MVKFRKVERETRKTSCQKACKDKEKIRQRRIKDILMALQ